MKFPLFSLCAVTAYSFQLSTIPSSGAVLSFVSCVELSAVADSGKKTASRSIRKKNAAKSKRAKPRQKAKQSFQSNRMAPPLVADYMRNRMDGVEQALRRNDDTISASCPHYETCGGCTMIKGIETPVITAAQNYFAAERYQGDNTIVDETVFPLVVPTKTTGWRTQAKLVAASKSSSSWMKEGCVFGLYQKGTHDVLPIPECLVHHPAINQAISLLEAATAKANIGAYEESSKEGDLRYVQLQTERSTGKVCLTLVWNAVSQKKAQPGLSRLVKELEKQSLWHSIWCHCNDSVGNNIFSRNPNRWSRLVGPEYLREPIPVASIDDDNFSAGWFYFTPMTFRQGNMDGFDILANDVARSIPGGSKVCELYAGVGVLGLTTLAFHEKHGNPLQWLRCSDENPANPRCFQRSFETLSGGSISKQQENIRKRGAGSFHSNDDDEITLQELMQQTEFDQVQIPVENNRASYTVATASQALTSGQALGANALIIDPPRKGLEEEVMAELIKPRNRDQPYAEEPSLLLWPEEKMNWANDINLIIYVSCGFDALARDCDRLLSSRAGWSLESATGYLLFPGSDHVETMAIFRRR